MVTALSPSVAGYVPSEERGNNRGTVEQPRGTRGHGGGHGAEVDSHKSRSPRWLRRRSRRLPLMGNSLSAAGLRARIRAGRAGPWRNVGGKWQIRTAAFLAWHSAQTVDVQAASKRRGEVLEKLAESHPPRRRPVPPKGPKAVNTPARG